MMATSGSATVSTGLQGLRNTVADFAVDLNASGNTSLAFDVTLDIPFVNAPKMLAVPPLGHAGTYTVTYDASTPKLSLAVTGGVTSHANKTVPVILVAYDQP